MVACLSSLAYKMIKTSLQEILSHSSRTYTYLEFLTFDIYAFPNHRDGGTGSLSSAIQLHDSIVTMVGTHDFLYRSRQMVPVMVL